MTARRSANDYIDETRARNFRDPDVDGDVLDWSNPVERAAICLQALSWHTPADLEQVVTRDAGRAELAATWKAMRATDRQLFRRRAAAVIAVAARRPG